MIADGLYGRNFTATLRLYLQTLALLGGIGVITAALFGFKASLIATPIAVVVIVIIQLRVAAQAEVRVPIQLSLWPDWIGKPRVSILPETPLATGREFWLAESDRRFIRYVNNERSDPGQRELVRAALRESFKSRLLVHSILTLVIVSLAAVATRDFRASIPQGVSFVLGALTAAVCARFAQNELLQISTILPIVKPRTTASRQTRSRRVHLQHGMTSKTAA
jgi:hypothetical protein